MLLVEVVLAMLMVALTSVGLKSTRLCLRFRYSVTGRSSPVVSIPSTSVSSRCRRSLAASLLSRALLTETTSESEHHLWRESRDQEIAHGSFRRKLRKLRFRFEERREGVAAAR